MEDKGHSVFDNGTNAVTGRQGRGKPSPQAAVPRFTGLSHICINVNQLRVAVDYYGRLLGAQPQYCLPYWQNEGFFKAAGFLWEATRGEASVAILQVPGTGLTLQLTQYHYPVGRSEPVTFASNDVSGVRHVALKVSNIEEAFAHVKATSDTRLITMEEGYRVFEISRTLPEEVYFFDQDLQKADKRSEVAAAILSQLRCFSFMDKYGIQWEFQQGYSDIQPVPRPIFGRGLAES